MVKKQTEMNSYLTGEIKKGILDKNLKKVVKGLSLKGSSRNTSSTIAAERSGDVYHEFGMVTRLLMYLFK